MVNVCAVSCGRWAVKLTKREPDKDMPHGFNIEVTLFRDGQQVASTCYRPGQPRNGGWTYPLCHFARSYDIYAASLPKRESEKIGMFIRATEELGRYLLDGGTLQDWVWGPEPSSDASKVLRRRRKLEWIEIIAGRETYLMLSERYFIKGRNAPTSWITIKDGKWVTYKAWGA